MLLRQLVSPVAQQLLCACITADMRMHNTCCACGGQLYLEYLKNFEIQVYEESIQASPFKDYQSAWAHYQDWV